MISNQMTEYINSRYDQAIKRPQYREYYNQSDFMNFGYWADDTKNQKQACENLMERLLSFFPKNVASILDVACGKGATTAYLAKEHPQANVTGINISEDQLAIARLNAPECTFVQMNAADMSFPAESFDAVICVEAAFHFDTRERFLAEACRVLKEGGRLVLSDILHTEEGERSRASLTEENHVEDLDAYKAMLRRAGFDVLEVIDVTEQCWTRHFLYIVEYFHRQFLSGEIDREEMERFLDTTYGRVPDQRCYLLAAASKRRARSDGIARGDV
jgi:ubiquinone/menaquinone biosynthesis C-methylase UbiE